MVRLQLPPAPPTFASWCNSSMPGFDPEGLGANPSEAANSQPVSSKSERQSYKLRTLESYRHGLPILPLSVEVCTPVSETGRADAYQQRQPISNHIAPAPTKHKHLETFMNDILNKTIVLVLNRNWQAINVRTPQEAFCMMATNVGTALEIEGENHIRPVTWDEWITLPMRPQDNAVQTVRGPIRVPTVIVAVNFARVPKRRPMLCARAIRERDGKRWP